MSEWNKLLVSTSSDVKMDIHFIAGQDWKEVE